MVHAEINVSVFDVAGKWERNSNAAFYGRPRRWTDCGPAQRIFNSGLLGPITLPAGTESTSKLLKK